MSEVEGERRRPGRGTLALLTIPIIGFIVCTNIGTALAFFGGVAAYVLTDQLLHRVLV